MEKMRRDFEAWITSPPIEADIERHSLDPEKAAFPGTYKNHAVDLAWEAWQEASNKCEIAMQSLREEIDHMADHIEEIGRMAACVGKIARLSAQHDPGMIEQSLREIEMLSQTALR